MWTKMGSSIWRNRSGCLLWENLLLASNSEKAERQKKKGGGEPSRLYKLLLRPLTISEGVSHVPNIFRLLWQFGKDFSNFKTLSRH